MTPNTNRARTTEAINDFPLRAMVFWMSCTIRQIPKDQIHLNSSNSIQPVQFIRALQAAQTLQWSLHGIHSQSTCEISWLDKH